MARTERTVTESHPRPSPAASTVVLGRRIGGYVLLTPLASGGMGDVYVARNDDQPGRLFALKMAKPTLSSDPQFRTMFLREAALAKAIRHPNVVEVLECGEEDGELYEVMPLVEGDSLAGLLKRNAKTDAPRAPIEVVIRIAIDALRGLHAAHEMRDDSGDLLGLVHRDVSPQNILVDMEGHAKLTDFGVAKALYMTSDVTATGEFKGKTAYLSPEQVRSQPIDRRADVFAMGIVMWEAIAGKRLFRVDSAFETLQRVVDLDVPTLSTLRDDCPESLARVVDKALQRRADRRYPTARLMADDLEPIANAAAGPSRARTGAWVRDLVGEEIDARKRSFSALEQTSFPARSLHVEGSRASEASASSVRRRTSGRALGLWGGAIVLSLLLAGAALMVRTRKTTPDERRVNLDPSTTTSTVLENASAIPLEGAPPAPSSLGTQHSPETIPPSSPGQRPRTLRPSKRAPSPTPTPAEAKRLPFENNPFEQRGR